MFSDGQQSASESLAGGAAPERSVDRELAESASGLAAQAGAASLPDSQRDSRPPVEPPPTASAAAEADDSSGAVTTLQPEPDASVGRLHLWVEQVQRALHNRATPSFLISLIVHTALLLGMALWTFQQVGSGGHDFGIVASLGEPMDATTIDLATTALAAGEVTPDASASADAALGSGSAPETSSLGSLGSGLKDLAAQVNNGSGQAAPLNDSAIGSLIRSTSTSTSASLNATSIEGRKPQSRQRLALERGGNADSEAAVELALEWLAAHQKPNGSWSLVHTTEACGNYCTHPGSPERYEPAATGLALLAFLGAGYAHREGKYADVVKKGVYFLLQVMEETSHGGSFLYSSPQGMYNQGVASFALCEAYQLSRDESLRGPATKAIQFIVYAQNDQGGWGYLPKRPGDLTITGWQTMALKSADGAEIYIPAHTIVRIDKFLDSQTDKEKIFYGYTAPGKSETCTAIGLLLRLFRNWPNSDPRVLSGVAFLEDQGISAHDIYRNYYATLLMYHVGGPTFQAWNPRMRDSLVRTQNRAGHAKGSWYFDDKYGEVGGRLYTTAMAAMTLEVYYRFSPIYLNSERPFEF